MLELPLALIQAHPESPADNCHVIRMLSAHLFLAGGKAMKILAIEIFTSESISMNVTIIIIIILEVCRSEVPEKETSNRARLLTRLKYRERMGTYFIIKLLFLIKLFIICTATQNSDQRRQVAYNVLISCVVSFQRGTDLWRKTVTTINHIRTLHTHRCISYLDFYKIFVTNIEDKIFFI